MRVLLVDDEPLAVRRLALALRDESDVEIVGTASDGETALSEIRRLRPDIAILDVEMPGLTGIDVAAALAEEDGPEIVFLTAFDHYATEAFSVEATDYLLKPLRPDRLRQAIGRARRRRDERLAARTAAGPGSMEAEGSDDGGHGPSMLHLPDRHGGRDVPQSEIVWIEAAKDYVLIHTVTRSHILRATMGELAGQLRPTIVRIHRSAFVAVEAIQRRMRSPKGYVSLLLTDGAEVQVGPSYLQSVRTLLRFARPDLY